MVIVQRLYKIKIGIGTFSYKLVDSGRYGQAVAILMWSLAHVFLTVNKIFKV